MTARVYRCTRCTAVSTVYLPGARPTVGGCKGSISGNHAWKLAF